MLLIRMTLKCGDDDCGSDDRGGGWGRECVTCMVVVLVANKMVV